MYDGSVFEGTESAGASNPSFSNFSLSISNLNLIERQRVGPAKANVAAYVQQQQQQMPMYEDAPSIAPHIEPTAGAAMNKLSSVTSGKKKKWGLSSVFGSGDKSTTSLPPVPEAGYQGSPLKRTQSGNHPTDRAPVIAYPKKAKKEAERVAREAEKVKREAAERVQKERARAVLQKRNQLVEERRATNTKSEIEYGSFNATPVVPAQAAISQQSHPSSASLYQQSPTRDMRDYANTPGSVSAASVRSRESGHSVHSIHSQSQPTLSVAGSEAHRRMHDMGRHKARRRDEDDDHSMSSFDHNSLRSRSVLTIGTIDSE